MHFKGYPPRWNLAREGREVQKHSPTLPRFEIYHCFPFTPHLNIPEKAQATVRISPSLPSQSSALGSAVSMGTASPKTSCQVAGFTSEDISRSSNPSWHDSSLLKGCSQSVPVWVRTVPSLSWPLLYWKDIIGQLLGLFWVHDCSLVSVSCNQKGLNYRKCQKSSSWN